jgi:hypothetical protein
MGFMPQYRPKKKPLSIASAKSYSSDESPHSRYCGFYLFGPRGSILYFEIQSGPFLGIMFPQNGIALDK